MAEDNEREDDEDQDELAPRKGKRLIIIIVVLLALLGAAGAGLYFSGMLPMGGGEEEMAAEETAPEAAEGEHGEGHGAAQQVGGPVFYDLPPFTINLNTGGRGTSFMKMTVALELPSEEMKLKVQAVEPRIADSINTYLRELRASDLAGSAGLYRLREELLMRINKSLQPDQVNDVLFKELIVQ